VTRPRRVYDLRRTNIDLGAVVTWHNLTLREACQMVAYCATDNLGRTRKEAYEQANRASAILPSGVPFDLEMYRFEVIKS
jgi:hypothetical protein